MATKKITKSEVDKALPGFLWDAEVKGFGLRVSPSGAKSYIFQYRLGGRESARKRYTIGKHGALTPDEARAEAKRLALLVAQKIDPVEADKERRREIVDLAFDAFVETFVDKYLKKRWGDRWVDAAGLLRREAVPALGSKPLTQIKRADVAEVLDRVSDRPATARQLHAVMNRLFRWAVSPRGLIARSPMEGMEAPPAVPARDRVLTNRELTLLWEASEALGAPLTGFFRMLVLTAARRDEVAALEWSELSRAEALWTLPAARAKNETAHTVPLADAALELLDEAAGSTKWPSKGIVFLTARGTSIAGFSSAKKRLDAEMARLALLRDEEIPEPWRVHDIRRSVATGLQRQGVRYEVTEAVLNHVSGSKAGVGGVYQRHQWDDEKREALTAWSAHVMLLIEQPRRRVNKFQLITKRAQEAGEGEFAVDALPYGRACLLAASEAAARAHHFHQMEVDAIKRAERQGAALRDLIDACERVRQEANLSPVALESREWVKVAAAQLEALVVPEARTPGWSGNDIKRQAAEAAAQVWSDATGQPIARAGLKQRTTGEKLPLAELLDAVSLDLFGRRGILTGNHLRGS